MGCFFVCEINCKIFRQFQLLTGVCFGIFSQKDTYITMYYNAFHFCKEIRRTMILSSDAQMRIDGSAL